VGRHRPPPQHDLSLFPYAPLDQQANRRAVGRRARQKHEAGAILAGRWKHESERRRRLPQEAVRHLDEDAGAVARVRFAARRPAVKEIDEDLQALLDDTVRAAAFDVDDEADTTRRPLMAGIVQAHGGGWMAERLRV